MDCGLLYPLSFHLVPSKCYSPISQDTNTISALYSPLPDPDPTFKQKTHRVKRCRIYFDQVVILAKQKDQAVIEMVAVKAQYSAILDELCMASFDRLYERALLKVAVAWANATSQELQARFQALAFGVVS